MRSEFALPELQEADGSAGAEFAVCAGAAPRAAGEPLLEWKAASGDVWMSAERHGSEYCVRFDGLASFVFSGCGREIRVDAGDGFSAGARHLLIDQALPFALSLRGRLVLHACAVAIEGQAAAFLGPSGCGKSTLAAGLARLGASLITDDCLVLRPADQTFVSHRTYSSVRIWPDSAMALGRAVGELPLVSERSDKRLLAVGGGCGPTALAVAYLLNPEGGPFRVEPVRPGEAMAPVLKASWLLDTRSRPVLSEHFRATSEFVRTRRFYRVTFPRDLRRAGEVAERVLEDARLRCWMATVPGEAD